MTAEATESAPAPNPPDRIAAPGALIERHRLATRLWHWINAVAVIVLLGSGLMILNAHPHLYWGQFGANFDEPWFSVSMVFEGGRVPGWLTIPSNYSLSAARRWHLFFALVLGIPFGAPVRLRVERQLGYKHAKYVERIEVVATLDGIHGGKGGYWEDVADYEWYAGI